MVDMSRYIGTFINNRAKGMDSMAKTLTEAPFKKFGMDLQERQLELSYERERLAEEQLRANTELSKRELELKKQQLAQKAEMDRQRLMLDKAKTLAGLNPEAAANFLTANGLPVKYKGNMPLSGKGGGRGGSGNTQTAISSPSASEIMGGNGSITDTTNKFLASLASSLTPSVKSQEQNIQQQQQQQQMSQPQNPVNLTNIYETPDKSGSMVTNVKGVQNYNPNSQFIENTFNPEAEKLLKSGKNFDITIDQVPFNGMGDR